MSKKPVKNIICYAVHIGMSELIAVDTFNSVSVHKLLSLFFKIEVTQLPFYRADLKLQILDGRFDRMLNVTHSVAQ